MSIKLVNSSLWLGRCLWLSITALVFLHSGPSASDEANVPVPPKVVEEAATNEPSSRGDDTTRSAEPDTEPQNQPPSEASGSDEERAPEAPSSAPSPAPPPPVTAEQAWANRVLALEEQIGMGMGEPAQADALYHELAAELWTYQKDVYEALRTRSPDALDRRSKLTEMYNARVRLIGLVTPGLRLRLFGGGPDGMRELRREFANAKLDMFFQTLAIPRGLRRIGESVRESPLDDLWRLFELLFGVVVFRIWRRWAKTGLPDLRQQVLSIQPRTDTHLHTARFLWYLERFRGPLEWLGLISFASAVSEPGDLEEVATLVWAILLWTLLTRFGLLLVDALAARKSIGARNKLASLRLRSLRLIATWVLLTGLGLDLTHRYVGEAAIHTWAIRAFMLLLVPVILLLLHWWRGDIIRRLTEDASFSSTARRIGKREKGFGSYINAGTGVFYILGADLLKLSIRVASRFEGGRKIVATLLRREVERGAQHEDISEKPLTEELVLKLLTPDDSIIDGPFREGVDRLAKLAKSGQGASVAVIAERGGGLSTFLRMLKDELGDSMRIVNCPPGAPGTFGVAIAQEFELDVDADLHTELRPRLDAAGVRIIGVDNYHRMARPQMGGLAGMKLATAIAEAVGEDIIWIVTLTRASWPYIHRMLGDQAIVQEVIELPAWSQEQLAELFDSRCALAGIEPNYRRLVFPRQFEDGERDSLKERNRLSFSRILWELSDGNPEVAIRIFADCLRERPHGEIVVRLPQPAPQSRIAAVNRTTMLVLKVLIETELATLDDLAASIREPRKTLSNALAYCTQQGWIETVYSHYQITWAAYRPVKRVLVRRGLISR
jgi:hypothetical protein